MPIPIAVLTMSDEEFERRTLKLLDSRPDLAFTADEIYMAVHGIHMPNKVAGPYKPFMPRPAGTPRQTRRVVQRLVPRRDLLREVAEGMKTRTKSTVQSLRDRGFDRSRHIPFKGCRVSCSECEALAINGVPCHETGCPNQRDESDRESEFDQEQGS